MKVWNYHTIGYEFFRSELRRMLKEGETLQLPREQSLQVVKINPDFIWVKVTDPLEGHVSHLKISFARFEKLHRDVYIAFWKHNTPYPRSLETA